MNTKATPAMIADPVLAGKICPYCNGDTEYADSGTVTGKSEGMMYVCRPCKAWVGVHKGTDQALGSLASYELRQLRMLAHRWFDPIAVEGLINDFYHVYIAGMSTRAKGYYWLSLKMDIRTDYCHIAMFDEEECRRVIKICQPIVESLEGTGDIW